MVTAGYLGTTIPSVTDSHIADAVTYDQDGLDAFALWTTGFDTDNAFDFYHTLYSTNEEQETYNRYITDIDTYAVQHIMQFVLGQLPINDETWSEYISTIEEMGL